MKVDTVYSFWEQVDWMVKARSLLDAEFYPRVSYQNRWVVTGYSSGSEHINRNKHIDVIAAIDTDHVNAVVQLGSGPRSVTIDEKIDRKSRSTLFLETWSDVRRKAPGWMQPGVSKADVLLWAFRRQRPQAGMMVYTYKLAELVDWFWCVEGGRLWQEFNIPNRGWTTVGRSVPIRDIPADLVWLEPQYITYQMALFDLETFTQEAINA